MSRYEYTIGLETHVQLKTRSKMFCSCGTDFGAPPNTQVCPVCLGYPGAMPVMNMEAIRLTVLTGLMLNARISGYSKFDRKNYFYPDMPKNYQISQYDRPLCEGGFVEVDVGGRLKTVGITRIHLEEDVGKNLHFGVCSGVDFNRAGVPLMEIVSEPQLASPEEALAYLLALKQILLYAGVSDCNLEEGNLRCDVNCSVRPAGHPALGTKTEIKNLNTFKGVQAALSHELQRQVEVLERGGRIEQETRRWDPDLEETVSMRTKEDAHDYRYFPEPDLMPVALDRALVEQWAATLPELPRRKRERFMAQYGLPEYDARVLAADKGLSEYFEAAAAASRNPKGVSNWVMTEMRRRLAEKDAGLEAARITPEAMAELVALVDEGVLNSNSAKEVFLELFERGGHPREIVEVRGLAQVSDVKAMEALVERVIAEHSKSVDDYRKGKTAALKFLVGQIMRLSQGRANPQLAAEQLERRLRAEPPSAL